MRAFVDRIKAMEGKDGILSVSIVHCFPYCRRARASAAACWWSPTATRPRRTGWRRTRRGAGLHARQDRCPRSSRSRRRGCGRGQQCGAGRHRRAVRQRRRRRALRQHQHPAPPDRAQRRGRGHWADLGPDRGAAVLRCRAGRHFPAPLRRQDRPGVRPAGRRDGDGRRAGARLLAELRADAGAARRLRGRAHRRRRGGAHHQAHAGAGTRAVHQSRHRPARHDASSSSSRPTTSWRPSGPSPRR